MNRVLLLLLLVTFWTAKELLYSPLTFNNNNHDNNLLNDIQAKSKYEVMKLVNVDENGTNISDDTLSLLSSSSDYQNTVTLTSSSTSDDNNNEPHSTGESTEEEVSSTSCGSEFDKYGGIIVYVCLVLYCFVGLAILCEGEFKDSIVMLSAVLRLSPDVAGATLMAAGTSSPELFTALVAVFSPSDDIGSGTIVGSAIFNILIIIGSCAILSSFQFNLDWKPVTRDILINVVCFVYLYLSFFDEKITLVESILGCVLYLMYVVALAFNDRLMNIMKKISVVLTTRVKCLTRFCYENDEPEIVSMSVPNLIDTLDDSPYGPLEQFAEETGSVDSVDIKIDEDKVGRVSIELDPIPSPDDHKDEEDDEEVKEDKQADEGDEEDFEEMLQKNRKKKSSQKFSESDMSTPSSHPRHHFSSFSKKAKKEQMWILLSFPFEIIFYYTIPRVKGRWKHQYVGSFVMSLFWLAFLSIFMVKSAEKVGCILHIDDAVMGITVLAVGTSLPDCLASIAVAKTGRGNMAVCNALGSNIFDILVALCFPWTLSIIFHGTDVSVGSDTLAEDVIILFATLSMFYFSLIVTKWKLGRRVGYFLVLMYCFFIGYTILRELGIVVIIRSYLHPAAY